MEKIVRKDNFRLAPSGGGKRLKLFFWNGFSSLPFPAGTANKSKPYNDFSNQSSLAAMIDHPKSVRIVIQAFPQSRNFKKRSL